MGGREQNILLRANAQLWIKAIAAVRGKRFQSFMVSEFQHPISSALNFERLETLKL
jgi:hypothetical protein